MRKSVLFFLIGMSSIFWCPALSQAQPGISVDFGVGQDAHFNALVQIPYRLIDEILKRVLEEGPFLKVMDPSKSTMTPFHDRIKVSNLEMKVLGTKLGWPVVVIKPVLLKRNLIGLRIVDFRFKAAESLAPVIAGITTLDGKLKNTNKTLKLSVERILENIQQVIDEMIVPRFKEWRMDQYFNPKEIVRFSYDEKTRTILVKLSDHFLFPMAPEVGVSEIALTKNKGLSLTASSEKHADVIDNEEYTVGIDAPSLNEILDNVLIDPIHWLEIEFDKPLRGLFTVQGKINTYKHLYVPPYWGNDIFADFKISAMPTLLEKNKLLVSLHRVKILRLYSENGYNVPDPARRFRDQGWFQVYLMNQISRMISNNRELASVLKITQLDFGTLQIDLNRKTFLPYLSGGVILSGAKVQNQKLFLKYQLDFKKIHGRKIYYLPPKQ